MTAPRATRVGDQITNPRSFATGTVKRLYIDDGLEVAVTTDAQHLITEGCTNVTALAEQMPEGARVRARVDREWTGTVTRPAYLMSGVVAIDIDWDHRRGGAYSAAHYEVVPA